MKQAELDLLDRMDSVKRLVDETLDSWLPKPPGCTAVLSEAMRYSVFPGGKRLRPALVIFACEACGGQRSSALAGACAVELVHCYSLVHDDLPAMDDDELRRGKPSCHKAFGEATAILAGDALLTFAFEVIARHSETLTLAGETAKHLAAAAGPFGMVGGQQDDLAAESSDQVSLGLLRSIHERKTGALLAASVRIGAALGRGSGETLQALTEYGSRIGLLFQMVDDLLDASGSQKKLGKKVHKDSGRGKLTYPALLGVERSSEMARDLCRQATASLSPLGEAGATLCQLAEFVVERDH